MPNMDGDSGLGDPRSDHKYQLFAPPAWLLDLAQRKTAQSSVSPDTFKTKLQEIKEDARGKERSDNDAVTNTDLAASSPYLPNLVRGNDIRKQQQA
ncbi:hypothetical protein J1614_012256 [Plenodomus biglobosus]|nr:hypothetical protein J1614_012256 [Plenodomus biglobosus]